MLKPINIVQAAEADLKRIKHNATEAEFQDPHYQHYAFYRKHVHAAKSARELMIFALMEPHVCTKTNKANMKLIYGNAALLIQAINLCGR
jgi:hypothetical protein